MTALHRVARWALPVVAATSKTRTWPQMYKHAGPTIKYAGTSEVARSSKHVGKSRKRVRTKVKHAGATSNQSRKRVHKNVKHAGPTIKYAGTSEVARSSKHVGKSRKRVRTNVKHAGATSNQSRKRVHKNVKHAGPTIKYAGTSEVARSSKHVGKSTKRVRTIRTNVKHAGATSKHAGTW